MLTPTAMRDLPVEICGEIAKELCSHCNHVDMASAHGYAYSRSKADLYNLCLVNKKWRAAAAPALYHAYNSTSIKSPLPFLRTLIQHPDLAAHVQSVFLTSYLRHCTMEGSASFKDVIGERVVALGLNHAEYTGCWDASNLLGTIGDDLGYFLEEMILLHIPNIVSFTLMDRPDVKAVEDAFKYLTIASQNPQQWHGMERLRYVAVQVDVNSSSKEQLYIAYFTSLALLAPNVQSLYIREIFHSRASLRVGRHIAKPPAQTSVPPPVAAFLANIKSLKISSHPRFRNSNRLFGQLIRHCESVEEVQYSPGCMDASSAVQIMRPLAPTLKRLRLSLDAFLGNRTIWDGFNNHSAAAFKTIAGFNSLEVLRFDCTGRCPNELPVSAHRPDMTAPLMRALPKSLRVLFLSGCEWAYLVNGVSQLRDLVKDGMLPNFRTFHVACNSLLSDQPFTKTFAELGIDMKIYQHRVWAREEHAAVEGEGWMT